MTGRRAMGPVARGVGRHPAVVLVYCIPAVVLWWHAWDGHLASTLACNCGDTAQEVWFVAWPAHALAHGSNPFFSPSLYAPRGVNLLSNTSAPLVGLVLAPVTWLAGPVAATNIALTLAPALSAWGCWIACRRFTRWRPAAWVAGLLFGYSPFVVTNVATGHVMLALLVVPPLLLVAFYELLVARRGQAVRWGAAIGVLAAVQFLISPEVLAMAAPVGAVGAVALVALKHRSLLSDIGELVRGLVAALVVRAALLAYPVWFLLFGPSHLSGPPWMYVFLEGNRLFDLWDPGRYGAPANALLQLGGYEGLAGPPSVYLGYGTLILAAGSLAVAWRRRLAWWAGLMAAVAFLLSLGVLLWTSPDHYAVETWLPWRFLGNLPLLDEIAPQRFGAYTDLFVALLVAVGLEGCWLRLTARPRSAGEHNAWPRQLGVGGALLALSGVALAGIWVTYQVPLVTQSVAVPDWFMTAGRTIPVGSVVLTYPFPFPTAGTSGPMVWQAEDGMRFRLAGGYAKSPAANGEPLTNHPNQPPYGTLAALSSASAGTLPMATAGRIAELRTAMRRWDVTYVVVTDTARDPDYAASFFTAAIGSAPQRSHGASVWNLRVSPVHHGAAGVAASAVRDCATATATATGPTCVVRRMSPR